MQNFGRKPEGKGPPLGKYGHRWKENTRMGVKEILCESVDWIYLSEHKDQ